MTALRDGAALARAYDFIVFPGHHEYVFDGEYDAVRHYRNRGGHLAFLSANNFFARVTAGRATSSRTARWARRRPAGGRTRGHPVHRLGHGDARGPWTISDVAATGWLSAATGLRRGSRLGSAGIEIDSVAPSSPRNIRIVSVVPNLFGPGLSAHMTYYETRRGSQGLRSRSVYPRRRGLESRCRRDHGQSLGAPRRRVILSAKLRP